MQKILFSKHEHTNHKEHPHYKDEISGVLKEDGENMDHNLEYFQKIVQYYYDNEWSVDYGECTWEEVQIGHDAHLYTLIRSDNKDVLVKVGSWEYNSAVFTKSGIEETRRLRNSPLPLFVVTAWADQEQKINYPRRFLNEHAMLYSPKWGQVETRMTFNERKKSIDYGKSNGIFAYEEAMAVVQSAIIKKMFYDRKAKNHLQKRFVDEMKILKTKDVEQFVKRYEVKSEFYSENHQSVLLRRCLEQLGEGKTKNIYDLIQRFDPQSGTFTSPNSKF